MKGGPKSSLRPFLHRALQLFKKLIYMGTCSGLCWVNSKQKEN